MKSLALALVTALSVMMGAAAVAAQAGRSNPDAAAPAAATPETRPELRPQDAGTGSTTVVTPGSSVPKPASEGSGEGAALPRPAPQRTTIFGLTPTAAVIIAAALLLVVIVAIVAMTREPRVHTDIDTRPRP